VQLNVQRAAPQRRHNGLRVHLSLNLWRHLGATHRVGGRFTGRCSSEIEPGLS
jgi:hypothetical protein